MDYLAELFFMGVDYVWLFIKYVLILFIFWEFFLAKILGVSVWTIMGVRFGSNWALKNFSPKYAPVRVRKRKNQKQEDNQDLFYEDA